MLAYTHPAFDGPMILFQDVIKILHGGDVGSLLQNTLVFELYNRRRVRGMLVGVDDSRHRMVLPSQRFGSRSALLRPRPAWPRGESRRLAPEESTARYRYRHLP